MGICSNCNQEVRVDHRFCSHCGWPFGAVAFRQCDSGHTIYETFKSCPFCTRMKKNGDNETVIIDVHTNAINLDTEVLNMSHTLSEAKTLLENQVDNDDDDKTILENPENTAVDKTILESDNGFSDKTVLESNLDTVGITVQETAFQEEDKTRLETFDSFPDKTVLESDPDKTILDNDLNESPEAPSFFAWVVFLDRSDIPLQDFRLVGEKTKLGKDQEADIRINDDFASKLHALIYYKDEEDTFYVSDLGSTNHTWLNDEEVITGELKDGDRIRIGHQQMVFKRVERTL
ncbi:MAG: FHA domain-containing protein [bacterium]|nr:FHA domain-containing protein [bacterium]